MNEIQKINALTLKLEKLEPISSENKKALDKKMKLEFHYNTNHIEGNTLTYLETELLLIFDEAKGDHSLREYEEMKGSEIAFHMMQDMAKNKERPLSENDIKYLNQILLVRPFWKDAITENGEQTRRMIKVGEYKEYPNSVRLQNGEIFHYASPIETPALMAELIEWYRQEEAKNELHPVILAALLHYKFVRIHPFDDGNGRISRLLMNYVLLKNNLPPIIIKSTDKKNYLAALNRADAGDLDSFIQYVASQLIWSMELTIKATVGEKLDEPGDLDKKIKLLKQKLNSTNEVVEIRKSPEAILNLLEHSLIPLFNKISEKLSEFDSLFKVTVENLASTGSNNLGSNLENSIKLLKSNLNNNKTFSKIYYNYDLKGFRKGTKAFNVDTSIFILLYDNVYEVGFIDSDLKYSKLYNQVLSKIEIKEIVEYIGTKVYNKIEQNIEQN
jgi:Fic family protein